MPYIKPIGYCDLDGVVADFDAAWLSLKDEERFFENDEKKVPHEFFLNLPLIDGAIDGIRELSDKYDLYFLSTPQWSNPFSWMEKRLWVEKHFNEWMFKRLILTHNKSLLRGEFLIDDRITNGVAAFEGEHIHFGSKEFPNWNIVTDYLINKVGQVKKAGL
jgi:5'-nucleotidase